MNAIVSLLHYTVPFIVVITPLVFVHEMGHFLLARWNGVRVEVFSIGFGRELFGWTDRHKTRWKISLLPLGGYVKMFGQAEPDMTGSTAARAGSAAARDWARSESGREDPNSPAELTDAERDVSYNHKRIWQRAAISVAGPAANLLFAILLTAVIFATYGQQLSSTQIGAVIPGSAAEAAGLKPGDKILSANGQHMRRFEDLAAIVGLGLGEPLKLQVQRGDQMIAIDAQPKIIVTKDIFGNVERIGQLGVQTAGAGEIVHYDPVTALWMGTVETYRTAAGVLKSVGQMLTGARSPGELSGIVSIAKMSSNVFEAGFGPTISFIVFISINLGLINLFPIPLLDGGHLMFYAIEAVSGRKPGVRAEEWSMRVGLALVFSLMLFALWNDLVRYGVISYIANLFA
jgi:regulator of sigma E protease